MPNPVIIDFIVQGIPQITRATKTVADTVAKSERASAAAAARGAAERGRLVDQEARARVRAMIKADAEIKRIRDKAIRETEKAAHADVRAVERAAQMKVRAMQRADDEIRRIQDRAARDVDRRMRQEERAQERMANAGAARWVRQQETRRRFDERQAATERRQFITTVTGAGVQGVSAGIGRVASVSKQVAGVVSQLGGGFSVADAVAERGRLERAAAMFSNSAFIPGVNKRVDKSAVIAKSRAASAETGYDASELLEAARGYVAKSADVEGGMANMSFFGRLSKATGADLGSVAKTAGILRAQNKNLGPDAMKQMLLDVVMQGKQGSVEMEDLAKSAGKVTRTSAAYAGSQTDNQRRLLGLTQIAVRTSGSTEEAATVLSNISADAMKHRNTVGQVLGKDFLTSKGQIAKNPEDFIADIMGKTGGNLNTIQGMGFGMRSMKMFQALAPVFNEAEATRLGQPLAKGESEKSRRAAALSAGRSAVAGEMAQVTGAKYTEKNLSEDFENVQTGMEKAEQAMRELRAEVGEKLLPEFVKLIPTIKEMTPALVDLLKTGVPAFTDLIKSVADFASQNKEIIHDLAAHPFATLIGYELTKSFAAAALPSLLQRLMTNAFAGGGMPMGGGMGPGGAMGGPAGAGGGVAGGLAVTAGAALQAGALAGDYSQVSDAQAAGKSKASALAAEGGTAAQYGMMQAQQQTGTLSAINAYAAQAGRVASFLNPATLLGKVASDKAQEAITGKNSEKDRIKTYFEAKEIVDSVELRKAVTSALVGGANDAKSGIAGALPTTGTPTASRVQPMTARSGA